MKKIRKILIHKICQLSPNMRRITFSGKDLLDFPPNIVGSYVKLLFSKNNLARPYSVRAFRPKSLQIDIDFSNHSGDQGYATKWAYNANLGDEIYISGPGYTQELNLDCNWFFFVGDMTALPSISVHLENLSSKSSGIALIEVLSTDDILDIIKPENIMLKWVVKSECNFDNLINSVSKIKWPSGNPFVWVACEHSKMVQLRNFFQTEKKIKKRNMYVSSYWKMGLNQEQHKSLKKNDIIK